MFSVEKAGIVTNRQRDTDFSKTSRIIEMLKNFSIEPILPEYPTSVISSDDSLFKNSDFIITLGGDGTILSVAEMASLHGIPVMGINIGNLGYLTDCSFEGAEEALKRLIRGDYVRQKRMMLNASVNSGNGVLLSKCCLNDVCITRGAASKIIRFELYINDNFVDDYSADGIIVSTPTGSTAYNLSAGGPILIPSSEMIAITPICPHTLTSRPIVAASVDSITIKVVSSKKPTMIMLDGQLPINLSHNDIVTIGRAETHIDIIKTNKLNFYDILRKKLINAGSVDI